jgi:shikimate kinase
MKGQATCFGAGTIVNAIATGRGAAFALALRATATAEPRPEEVGVRAIVPGGVDPALVVSAAGRVLDRSGKAGGLEVAIDSEIPMSRGLKSSSAVANAVVEACAQALDLRLDPKEVLDISVDAGFDARVTVTGAFDDASASLLGGVCVTDNRARRILALDRLPEDLVSVVWIPRRTISKSSLKGIDFSSIRPLVEEAFHLALRGDYFRAMELNSTAYAPLLGVDETPAVQARSAGAVAAGITGAGPAVVALTKPSRADAVRKAMDDGEAEVRIVGLHVGEPRQVIL